MDAGCCHSVRANGWKFETLSERPESVDEEQLKFEAVSSEPPISQRTLSAYHDPSLLAPITAELGGFVRLPQSTTTTSSATLLATTATTPPWAFWRLGLCFSLSTPSNFIRGAAASLPADTTTLQRADRVRYRSSIEQRSLAACGF
jgi:hypothetical protein